MANAMIIAIICMVLRTFRGMRKPFPFRPVVFFIRYFPASAQLRAAIMINWIFAGGQGLHSPFHVPALPLLRTTSELP